MTGCDAIEGRVERRVERGLVRVYPRLLVQAHRLTRRNADRDFEAADLCQDGACAAMRFVLRLDRTEVTAWSDEALAGTLFVVAARTMHCQIIDHIRRAQRHRSAMVEHGAWETQDVAFPRQQAARDALRDLVAETRGSTRAVLLIAIEMGEVDIPTIASRSGLSASQIYRLLSTLAHNHASSREPCASARTLYAA